MGEGGGREDGCECGCVLRDMFDWRGEVTSLTHINKHIHASRSIIPRR